MFIVFSKHRGEAEYYFGIKLAYMISISLDVWLSANYSNNSDESNITLGKCNRDG